jgi:hypothetical protein
MSTQRSDGAASSRLPAGTPSSSWSGGHKYLHAAVVWRRGRIGEGRRTGLEEEREARDWGEDALGKVRVFIVFIF